jgi:hypothetical protein
MNKSYNMDLANAMIAQANDTINTISSGLLRKGANCITEMQRMIDELTATETALKTELDELKARPQKKQYDYAGVLKAFMDSGKPVEGIDAKTYNDTCTASSPDAGCFRTAVKKHRYPIDVTQRGLGNGRVKILLIRTDM